MDDDDDAAAFCWRREMKELVAVSQLEPSLAPLVFPERVLRIYWSSRSRTIGACAAIELGDMSPRNNKSNYVPRYLPTGRSSNSHTVRYFYIVQRPHRKCSKIKSQFIKGPATYFNVKKIDTKFK